MSQQTNGSMQADSMRCCAQGTPRAAMPLCSVRPKIGQWEAAQESPVNGNASGPKLGRPMGAPKAYTTQHAVRTSAGVYSFCVTEFLQQAAGSSRSTSAAAAPAARMPEAAGAAHSDSDADVAERPYVAFLHGFLGSVHDWRPVAAALTLRCRCFAVDLPAHGSTRLLPGSVAGV